MRAADILKAAREAGLRLEAEGDGLVVFPAAKLTSGLRAALIAAKPEILKLLRAEHFSVETCTWCGTPIETVPNVLAVSRRLPDGTVLHPRCWNESTRPAEAPAAAAPRSEPPVAPDAGKDVA